MGSSLLTSMQRVPTPHFLPSLGERLGVPGAEKFPGDPLLVGLLTGLLAGAPQSSAHIGSCLSVALVFYIVRESAPPPEATVPCFVPRPALLCRRRG